MPDLLSWKKYPSHVALETPYDIASLFLVTLEPFASRIVESTESCWAAVQRRCPDAELYISFVGVLVAAIERFTRYSSFHAFAISNLLSVWPVELFLILRATSLPLFTLFRNARSISSAPGCHLTSHDGADPAIPAKSERVDRKVGKLVFPLGYAPKNVVFASSAESLLLSIIQVQTAINKKPVVFLPGFLLYPHASLVPMLKNHGITLVGYEVHRENFAINIPHLRTVLSSHSNASVKCFLLLLSLQGRRIQNRRDVCETVRTMGVFSVEVVVPTLSMYHPSDTSHTPPEESLANPTLSDVLLVSFKAVSFLDGAIGLFKDDNSAIRVHEKMKMAKSPSASDTWLLLMKQFLRIHISSPVGFGLFIQWMTFCSFVVDTLLNYRQKDEGDRWSKVKEKSANDVDSEARLWIDKTITSHALTNGEHLLKKPSSTQLNYLLILLSRYFGTSMYALQLEGFWSFLKRLPPYINVLTVGDPTNPLDTTEVMSSSGFIVYAAEADKVVHCLRQKRFEGVQLVPYEARKDNSYSPYWRDKLIYFEETRIGASMVNKLVLVPFNLSMKPSIKKQLLDTLIEMPPSYFGAAGSRSYCTREVDDILASVHSRKYYVPPIISKL